MTERTYELPAIVRRVWVGLLDGDSSRPRVCVDYETVAGHTFWFLPVAPLVVGRLCQLGEVQQLEKLPGKSLIVVRSHRRLHGFKHLTNPALTLLGPDLWGEAWQEN